MSRRPVPLTGALLEALAALEGPCGRCAFWELDPVRRARLEVAERVDAKREWLRTVQREWGECGRVVLEDGRPVAWATYAPAAFVPGAGCFATAPVSPDAVLLSGVHVEPGHTGAGLGRVLVQSVAADLVERGDVVALEAFGHHPRRPLGDASAPTPASAPGPCTVPVDFLVRVGFTVHRPHLVAPRLRLHLRSTVTWRDEVEAAVRRVRGVVARPPHATPSPSRLAQGRVTGTVGGAEGGRLR